MKSLSVAASLAFVAVSASRAEAQELRFSDTVPGNVIAVGNTLGLSKQINFNGPGTSDAIGTFITLDGLSMDTDAPAGTLPWPLGTTSDWTENGSTATLTLPLESEVLYAELVWGGSYAYGNEDVTAMLDTPVTLTFGNDSLSVAPDPATATTIAQDGSFTIRYYMRSAEVTDFIAQHGTGTYAVEGVPATQASNINQLNAAGWSLVLAYRYDSEKTRNLSIFVGDTAFVDENTTIDYGVSGFCAPPAGEIEGTIAISTIEGDSNRVGDQLAIGQTAASNFVNLSGPNNPSNNFFCSQINGATGALDTSGSFGNANHTPGSNSVGGRQGWDVTTVQMSSVAGQLAPGQTSAVLRTQTLDDSYMPILAGIAIDVNAPGFVYGNSTTSAAPSSVTLGDTFAVTATLLNEGTATANGVELKLPLPSGLGLVDFSTDGSPGDIGGNPVVLSDVTSGVDMGTLAPGQQRTVTLHLSVDAPQSPSILILPQWHYLYTMCTGSSSSESFTGQAVGVTYEAPVGEGGGGAGQGGSGQGGGAAGGNGQGGASSSGGSGPIGDGGGAQDGGATSDGGSGQGGAGLDIDAQDGCSCDVATRDRASFGTWLSIALASVVLGRARRGGRARHR